MSPQKTSTDPNWQAMLRGSILSTTISKHVSYISIADRRAQVILTINAILIPLALNGSQNQVFYLGAIVSILSGFLSTVTAIISLYPKPKGRQRSIVNYLHFSQMEKMSEQQYLDVMREALSDGGKISEMATREIYHLGRIIISPKFLWLKISYFIFLIGNFIAIGCIIVQLA